MEEKNSSLNIKKNKSENIETGKNISEFIDKEDDKFNKNEKNIMQLKKYIENYLHDNYEDNLITKKIMNMIFEGYDNSIKIKNELIEKIDILKKAQKNIQIKIDEIIRKIQIEKKKKIEDLQKIKINIDLNHFPKKSTDNNFNNIFIFNLFYNNSVKPTRMSEDTKDTMNHEKRYNMEILDYVNYVAPKEKLIINMEKTINTLKKLLEKKYPEWEIYTFGSYKQNISTIYSDLDITIITINTDLNLDKKISILSEILRDDFIIKEIIINATVPIIKAYSKQTKIELDISVDNSNGIKNSMIIMNAIKNKKLRNIMIILKILLKINNLEKTTLGGMNSFLLFHLVYYFVVIKNSTKTENEFQLLHNFLFYYGFEFDNSRYMLDMKGIKSEMIHKKKIKY